MNASNLIMTAWYSIKAYKLRIFLTMIGIIIGVSSVSTILAVGNGLSEQALKSMDSSALNTITVTYNQGYMGDVANVKAFKESDLEEIKRIDGVKKVEKNKQDAMFTVDFKTIAFFDKTFGSQFMKYDTKTTYPIEVGNAFSKKDAESDRRIVILGYDAAETLFGEPKKSIGKAVNINGELFEVVGVRKAANFDGFTVDLSMDMGASLLPKKTLESMNKKSDDDKISNLSVTIQTDADAKAISNEIVKKLKGLNPDVTGKYTASSGQEFVESIRSMFGYITTFVALVTGISLLVGGIGVMNIMYVSITERRREIGIRRAIGAKPMSILMQFLVEAIFITGAGGLIGILIGFIVSNILGAVMPFKPVMTTGNFLLASSISVLTGIIFGVIPAYKAAKLDPIKAIYQ